MRRDDPALAEEHRRRAVKRIEERYTWDTVADLTEQLEEADRLLDDARAIGAAEALQITLQGSAFPSELLQALPYAVTMLVLAGCSRLDETVTPAEVRSLIAGDSTVVLLDVRTPEEFASETGHLSGALLIPVQELEQRTREMTLLSEMGDILRACFTTEEVYDVIMRVAREIFPKQGGALFVIGPSRSIVESVAEWGDVSGLELTFTPDECWALRRGRVHLVEDTRVGLLCKHLHAPSPGGYLCVPMMAQSEAVGVLHVTIPEGTQMPEAKRRVAMAMAEHVAMALSNLRLHERLRNQSIRDQLTGLFNRSFMEESLELELRRASRSQLPLSVIMLELDNFQSINDNYGLEVGDSILRRTGMLLQANVRKGDIACRYSNQTYVVLLPQSNYDIGRQRAENADAAMLDEAQRAVAIGEEDVP